MVLDFVFVRGSGSLFVNVFSFFFFRTVLFWVRFLVVFGFLIFFDLTYLVE